MNGGTFPVLSWYLSACTPQIDFRYNVGLVFDVFPCNFDGKNLSKPQNNPDYTFVLQGPKEGWMRYAIPFIASCLPALAKKELISAYETAMLNIGRKAFIHVTYGESGKT